MSDIKVHSRDESIKTVDKSVKETVKGVKTGKSSDLLQHHRNKNSVKNKQKTHNSNESKNFNQYATGLEYSNTENLKHSKQQNIEKINISEKTVSDSITDSKEEIKRTIVSPAYKGNRDIAIKQGSSLVHSGSIKSTSFKDIKTPGTGTAHKIYSEINDGVQKESRSDKSFENQAMASNAKFVGTAGAASYITAKMVNNIPARISRRRNVVPAQKELSKLHKELKVSNRESKRNIKQAKSQYKDIKRYVKKNKVSQQTIKNAKGSYKKIKDAEKYNIRVNKKIEKKAAKELKKAINRVKNLKLYASIAAGLLAIIIMAALIGLLTSPLSIMFADEDTDGSNYTVKSTISSLNTEFSEVINDIVLSKPHDTISISNYGCQYTIANWQDIFAVWDIKQLESNFVAVIEPEQYNEIRNVFWDMVEISSHIEDYLVTEKDEDGEEIEVVKKKLIIEVEYKNVDEMAVLYAFDSKQKKELKELMKAPEFTEIFSAVALDAVNPGTPIIGTGKFIYPTVSKSVSANYPYYSDGSYHGGVDFPVPMGSNVFAADDGVVSLVRKLDYGFGYYIMIDHGNGLTTLYGHNSKLLVEEGQTVHQGDVIALSGSTGNSTGPHCHFEVRVAGNRVNPWNYLK